MEIKKIEYHFELYVDSFINDPVWSVQASMPFPAVAIGDQFNHRALSVGWDETPNATEEFRVKDVEHIFWDVGNVIGHKLMIKLEIVSRQQDR